MDMETAHARLGQWMLPVGTRWQPSPAYFQQHLYGGTWALPWPAPVPKSGVRVPHGVVPSPCQGTRITGGTSPAVWDSPARGHPVCILAVLALLYLPSVRAWTSDMLVGNSPPAPGLERAWGEATAGTQLIPESSSRGFLSKKQQCKHRGNQPEQQRVLCPRGRAGTPWSL